MPLISLRSILEPLGFPLASLGLESLGPDSNYWPLSWESFIQTQEFIFECIEKGLQLKEENKGILGATS